MIEYKHRGISTVNPSTMLGRQSVIQSSMVSWPLAPGQYTPAIKIIIMISIVHSIDTGLI
jgi:hypothetical protein